MSILRSWIWIFAMALYRPFYLKSIYQCLFSLRCLRWQRHWSYFCVKGLANYLFLYLTVKCVCWLKTIKRFWINILLATMAILDLTHVQVKLKSHPFRISSALRDLNWLFESLCVCFRKHINMFVAMKSSKVPCYICFTDFRYCYTRRNIQNHKVLTWPDESVKY